MSKAIEQLLAAQTYAMSIRPKVGGFPYLAAALYAAGVIKNTWTLPSCQSIYVTTFGTVVQQGAPLISGAAEVAPFDQDALIRALRRDQEGKGTFPEFLQSSWEAGVVGYEVDFKNRKVAYYGAQGESYVEDYPAVEI